jgi:hypothetical protein
MWHHCTTAAIQNAQCSMAKSYWNRPNGFGSLPGRAATVKLRFRLTVPPQR